MPDIVIHVFVSAAYAGLAWHFWNTRWHTPRAEAGAGGLAGWERAALFAVLALHGWLLAREVFFAPQLRFGFAQALAVTLWLGVVIYWVESLFLRLDGFEPLILSLAALATPLPALFPGLASPALAASVEFKVHMLLAMCAYSLFTIAILHAMLMTLVERRLHVSEPGRERRAPLEGALAHLPPLLTLERLLFRLIGTAFAFLTLTLASGILFSETLFGRALPFNHKTLFALLSWVTFAALLVGRHFYGWRGRTALRWTLTGFVMLLFAYVGSRFVLEVVLGRS